MWIAFDNIFQAYSSLKKITGIIWLREVVEKLARKHNLTTDEVEEALRSVRSFRFIEMGDVEGEDLYAAMGRAAAGRYIITLRAQEDGRGADYKCQKHDQEGKTILCQEIESSEISFQNTSRAWPTRRLFGIVMI